VTVVLNSAVLILMLGYSFVFAGVEANREKVQAEVSPEHEEADI
jgi:hypothetical protein